MESFTRYTRARLQRECKALGIKANLSNFVMWELLTKIHRGEFVEYKYYKTPYFAKKPRGPPAWQKVLDHQQRVIEAQASIISRAGIAPRGKKHEGRSPVIVIEDDEPSGSPIPMEVD